MTEFERQVEAALRDQLRFVERFDLPGDAAQFLAPRVASAIVAAYDKVELIRQEGRTAWTPAEAREYALSFALLALRGET